MKKASLILLFFTVILFSCKKDTDSVIPVGGEDTLLLGSWGWYSFATRVFDDAGVEYETDPPFYYGRGDWWNDYKKDGIFYTKGDDGTILFGKWSVKNGKLMQDDTGYEYSFAENDRTLILKKSTDFTSDGKRYRRDEYSTLSKDWLP